MSCVTIFCENGKYDRSQYMPLPRHSPLWTASKAKRLDEMALSPDPNIRAIAANHPKTNVMRLLYLIEDKDPMVRRACLKNVALPYQILQVAFRDSDAGIRAFARMRAEEFYA